MSIAPIFSLVNTLVGETFQLIEPAIATERYIRDSLSKHADK